MDIKKETSSTLMVANLIATVFVIAIHYTSKDAIDISSGYTWNYFFQEFLTNGVSRVAVPFFAIISGFFLTNKIGGFQNYLNILRKKSRTLLIPYIVSSALILLLSIALNSIFFPENVGKLKLYSIARSIFAHPISLQFWFLRDLIILTVISPLILNNKYWYSYVIGALIALLWLLDIQIFPIVAGWYLINISTLFFFWLGGALFRFNSVLNLLIESSTFVKILAHLVWFTLICVRIYLDPGLDVWYVRNYRIESLLLYKIAILIGIICIVQFSSLIKNNKSLISFSGFTFFAFLFHLVPLNFFTLITARIIDEPFAFYVNFPIATIAVFLLAHLTFKYLNWFYTLLTGGRGPEKMLKRIQ